VKKPALIVIDMLNDFLDRWPPTARINLIDSINALAAEMRKRGFPVIWVRQEFEEDLRDAFLETRAKNIHITIRGTRGSEMARELNVDPSDLIVVKKRYSGFYRTNLDDLLAGLRVDALLVAGINTHACVRMTAIDAYQRDWPVVVAADCVDSYDREHHEVSVRYLKGGIASVLSNSEIVALLTAAKEA